ncbi:MAG: DoxX family protein [Archangium sp.]|nr:DoxX family protein [Archangium sp.]
MTAAAIESKPPSKALHIALWVVQVLLGLAFLMAGTMKATKPIAELATQMPWAGAIPEALVRFIGVSEFLGGLGLILPSALRIQPKLTPIAASGLTLIMILAGGFHTMRGEAGLPINLVMGGLAAFIAWGRFAKAPIAPR